MNTLRISPSAYIDSLTLPELQAELVLAASRLVGTRVVSSGLADEFLVCRECGCRGRDRHAILHTEDCSVGMVAHLLLAIAHAEAAHVSPTSSRKEPSLQENSQSCEPAETAAQEKRPFLLQGEPEPVHSTNVAKRWRQEHGIEWPPPPDPRPIAIPLLPSQYGEPLTLSGDGEVLNAEGHVIVDPYGCSLYEPDDLHMMRRIVACVNHCMGVPTDELCRETERAAAGGGR